MAGRLSCTRAPTHPPTHPPPQLPWPVQLLVQGCKDIYASFDKYCEVGEAKGTHFGTGLCCCSACTKLND